MCKPDYGSGIAEYFRKAFSKKLFGKSNTDAVKKQVKKAVIDDYITVADYNCTCDEMSIKDIIE